MLDTQAMKRVTFVGPKATLASVIEELHTLGVLHIIDHQKSEELDIGSPLRQKEDLAGQLVRLRSLASHLKLNLKKVKFEGKARKDLPKGIYDEVIAELDEKKELRARKKHLEGELKQLEVLSALKLDTNHLTGYESLAVFIGRLKSHIPTPELNKLKGHEARNCMVGKDPYVALFVAAQKREEASTLLLRHGFTEMFLTIETKDPRADARKKAREIKAIEKTLSDIDNDIRTLRHKYAQTIKATEHYLTLTLEKAEVPLRFGSTDYAYTVKGWVPADRLDEMKSRLNTAAGKEIEFVVENITRHEKPEPPIQMKNRKHARPFEFFMNLYTLPSYNEMDPSFLMFLTFPLLFGFMLGDMGYGFVTLFIFLIVRRKVQGGFKQLIDALVYASLSTILFGALFGEIFGEEIVFGYDLPRILSRVHDINGLMVMAVVIGAIHLNFALLLGWYNEARHHGVLHGFYAKGSWIIMQTGVALLALSYGGFVALTPMVGWVVFVISVYFIYKGEGARGLVELPAIFSNMLSYARLMAIGVSSVQIAHVVNTFAKGMFHGSIGGIIGGIVLLLIGHTINIMLGLIGPFLHSLRLHYVEFFSKFFIGGGKPYAPFGIKQK